MSVFEIHGGPIDRRYLMKKSKYEIVSLLLDAMKDRDALAAATQPTDADTRDAERLDLLEQMANEPEGILLHDGGDFTGRRGFGLRRIGRTLREALDAAIAASAKEAK